MDPVRRLAWFCCVIETDDEAIANHWLATVNTALDRFAHDAEKMCEGKVKIVEPMEAGQSIPVEGYGV